MNCPRCGHEADLYGLPAGIYRRSFKCYNCDPYGVCFTARTPEAYRACDEAKAQSVSNATLDQTT